MNMDVLWDKIVAVGGALLVGALGALLAIIRNKIANSREKVQKPMVEKFDSFMNYDFLLPILRNTFQTCVKNLKKEGTLTEEDKNNALENSVNGVINLLPRYMLDMAKKIFPSYKTSIKKVVQDFYEANKDKINIDIKSAVDHNEPTSNADKSFNAVAEKAYLSIKGIK